MSAHVDPPQYDCEVVPERDHVRVAPTGELDIASTPTLAQTIRELRSAGFDHLILDLRNVCFVDSTGVRLILDLTSAARQDSHRFELIPGSPEVQRVFELTGVLDELPFRASMDGRRRC